MTGAIGTGLGLSVFYMISVTSPTTFRYVLYCLVLKFVIDSHFSFVYVTIRMLYVCLVLSGL